MILPLIWFIDASNIDNQGRVNIEPIQFTLGTFNEKTRNLSYSWRPLGFIHDSNVYVRIRSLLQKSL